MPIKRIISEEVYQPAPKTLDTIAYDAIHIEIDGAKGIGSEDLKWDNVGRPLFSAALENLGQSKHDNTKTDQGS